MASDGLALSGDGKAAVPQMTNVLIIDFTVAAQLEATIRVPSIDFTFKTDALETSSAILQ